MKSKLFEHFGEPSSKAKYICISNSVLLYREGNVKSVILKDNGGLSWADAVRIYLLHNGSPS